MSVPVGGGWPRLYSSLSFLVAIGHVSEYEHSVHFSFAAICSRIRKILGVDPVFSLKADEKLAWLEYPHSWAICVRLCLLCFSNSIAFAMRADAINSVGVIPMVCLNFLVKWDALRHACFARSLA